MLPRLILCFAVHYLLSRFLYKPQNYVMVCFANNWKSRTSKRTAE